MKLDRYKEFTDKSLTGKSSIKESIGYIQEICRKYNIDNYTINEDGSIDVDDNNVNLSYENLKELPLKFNKVNGAFYCHQNQLTTLEGCPKEVGGNFDCYNNQLTSLEGGPKEVGGNFDCHGNELTSLEGCPKEVDGDFDCYQNDIKDVKGFNTRFTYLLIGDNPIEEIFDLFPYDRKWEVIQSLNEHEVIRGGEIIILQALELVYDDLELEIPDNIYEKEFKHYEVR